MWVYFIRYGDQVKVGLSGTPMHRFAHIQRQCPVRLEFMGAVPGSRVIEKSLHQRWAAQRLRFDWFAATPEVIEFIKANAMAPPPCRPHRKLDRSVADPDGWVPLRGPEPYNRIETPSADHRARWFEFCGR
jgi:hypothetical protein